MKVTVNDPAEKRAFKPVEFTIRCESMDELKTLRAYLAQKKWMIPGTCSSGGRYPEKWCDLTDFWAQINRACEGRE